MEVLENTLVWRDAHGHMQNWRGSSKCVNLGKLVESEKRLRSAKQNGQYDAFMLDVGFSSLEEIRDFFDAGDYACTDRAARTLALHANEVLRQKRKLHFVRTSLHRLLGSARPVTYAAMLQNPKVRRRLVPPDAAVALLSKLSAGEPGDYVRVLMQPLVTGDQTDVFELSGNGPALRTSAGQHEILSHDMEFFAIW